jgi:hypothetical protein
MKISLAQVTCERHSVGEIMKHLPVPMLLLALCLTPGPGQGGLASSQQ